MPQDIPVEASEVLAFTPPSLANIENPPVFRLRAVSGRDKRFQTRLYRELGLQTHGDEAFRREILTGLKALWTEEDFDKHSPIIKAYWEAQDDFALQAKDEPDLKWEYDADLETGIKTLIEKVIRSHEPLRLMLADNAEFGDMMFIVVVAVALIGWSNFDVKLVKDRGYITTDCVEALMERLGRMCEDAGESRDAAWLELAVAATQRQNLGAEEEKNSASPAPSVTSQALSNETNASEPDGKSPESPETVTAAPSPKTPKPA